MQCHANNSKEVVLKRPARIKWLMQDYKSGHIYFL